MASPPQHHALEEIDTEMSSHNHSPQILTSTPISDYQHNPDPRGDFYIEKIPVQSSKGNLEAIAETPMLKPVVNPVINKDWCPAAVDIPKIYKPFKHSPSSACTSPLNSQIGTIQGHASRSTELLGITPAVNPLRSNLLVTTPTNQVQPHTYNFNICGSSQSCNLAKESDYSAVNEFPICNETAEITLNEDKNKSQILSSLQQQSSKFSNYKTCNTVTPSPIQACAINPRCSATVTRAKTPLSTGTISATVTRAKTPLSTETCPEMTRATKTPLSTGACSATVARAKTPMSIGTCNAMVARAKTPLSTGTISATVTRAKTPLSTETCPEMTRATKTPLSTGACNATIARAKTPLSTGACSATIARAKTPMSTGRCNATVARAKTPMSTGACSATIARAKTPMSTGRCNATVARAKTPMSTGTSVSVDSTSVLMETEDEDIRQNNISNIRQVHSVNDLSRSDQVYMSVIWQGGKLGLAYYDVDSPQVYMMLDTVENDDFTMLKRVLQQIQPSYIVASSKQDERLLKTLKDCLPGKLDMAEEGMAMDSSIIQLLPSVDFSLDLCKRRILNLDLPSIPKHYTQSERTLYLSSLISFDNPCMIRATGGLLKYLEKSRIGVELEDIAVRVPIIDMKCFTLKDQMVLDDTAFSSLQLFQKESHPSVYKTGYKSAKEGLSLFGIMNRCKSQLGSKKLRTWFLRPLRDIKVLCERHDAITFFINPRNIEIVSTLTDCLKNIKNISRGLARMIESQGSVPDWQALYKTTYHAIYIGDVCRAQSQNINIFKKISESFSEDLIRIATLVSKIVDFEESTNQGRFVVKPGVDSELDERKRTYNGLPDFMTKVAKEELDHLSNDITECNVIYLPQLGYLLSIPKLSSMKSDEDYLIPGLEFVFMSNNMLHYKSASTRELDRLLGDTQCEIADQETSIMHKLQNLIVEHSKSLVDVMDLCAELDCLLTLAMCAREFNYVKPTLVEESVIKIKAGRHPLQEMCCSPFVPNDTYSDHTSGAIKIITGPNASGKSVYLKQVGLIVYLAHIGSFVPAEQATIGMFDRIFTRVRSLESVSVGLSTFMIDINQMAEGLRNATEHSLVLVDEFGKGTDLVDGLALLYASILHWNDMKGSCPHVMVSTHFHSLTHQQLIPQSPLISYLTMDTVHDGDDLYFLYQVKEGHTSSSFASRVAAQAGLPQEIINRGSEVSKLIKENKPVNRVDTPGSDVQLQRCEAIVKRFMELDLEKDNLQAFLQDFVLPASKGLKNSD